MTSLEEVRLERLKKVALLRQKGINPYPADSKRDFNIDEFLSKFENLFTEASAHTLAGRVMSLRAHGGAIFLDLYDGTGRVQAYLKKDEIGDEAFTLFTDVVDSSDFIEITGTAFKTKRGQQTILSKSWRMLAKSLRAIPDEWFGLKNEEERFRRRYIDLLLNDKTVATARKRSIFWNTLRQYLLERDFLEVETPVLENKTGGADARPFSTHHHGLDIDLYLRISAGELWQKQLLVGGLPRVFEIGRIFRNEGMSREHLQDYTQLEFYMAYTDYLQGMEMIRELYQRVAKETFGTTSFTIQGHTVDLAKKWETYNFSELVKKETGIDPLATTIEKVEAALTEAKIKFDKKSLTLERGVDMLWKKIRRTLAGPGFLVGVPVYLEPLAKRSREDDRVVERFQVIIAGSEMGKGFSELNDPEDQRQRFERQQAMREAGDEEAQMADMDFVEALEYGMPPAFGFGLSERLFSFLMDQDVREGQLFPLMRPKKQ